MSWKDILKVSLDKEGNKYREPKHSEGPLTGPAMVLAEKARRPIYVVYTEHYDEAGFLFNTLEEAKEVDEGKIITVKETDKKTLMAAFKLYKEIAKEERVVDPLNPNKTQILINNYLSGKEEATSHDVHDELYDAIPHYSDVGDSLEMEKLKMRLVEVLEEIHWMRGTR